MLGIFTLALIFTLTAEVVPRVLPPKPSPPTTQLTLTHGTALKCSVEEAKAPVTQEPSAPSTPVEQTQQQTQPAE